MQIWYCLYWVLIKILVIYHLSLNKIVPLLNTKYEKYKVEIKHFERIYHRPEEIARILQELEDEDSMQYGDEDISEDADDPDYEKERIEDDNLDSDSEQQFEGADVEGYLELDEKLQIYIGKDNETIWIFRANNPNLKTVRTFTFNLALSLMEKNLKQRATLTILPRDIKVFLEKYKEVPNRAEAIPSMESKICFFCGNKKNDRASMSCCECSKYVCKKHSEKKVTCNLCAEPAQQQEDIY
ncbi:hypothetical protein HHI36_005376 [Cryptolaemus montrouzieri]|uniref:PiggyBac transposable element-derived protein domain-containing protein n=1 Tax=Cryptolaemus montrouzieri TaxID=559131 RepID=A0ABD2NUG2_9CUCU